MSLTLRAKLNLFHEYMLQNTSCHGGNWVLKFTNVKAKSMAASLLLTFQIAVIAAILWSIFFSKKDFTTSMAWENEEDLLYPNITICNPRLFDRSIVEGEYRKYSF